MPERRTTRQISVGNDRTGRVLIGGGAGIAVQTMTSGYTYEIDECVAERIAKRVTERVPNDARAKRIAVE